MSLGPHGRVRAKRLLIQASLALALVVMLAVPKFAFAQHHGGGAGGPGGPGSPGGLGGPGGGFPGGRMSGDRGGGFARAEGPRDISRGNPASMHAGLQVGPPGRWWDDKHFVKQLKLTSDQQKHMDEIFEQSRPVLLKRYDSLEQEELRMEALTHAKTLDEGALFAQIDRVEQARADLGKATTHYLVQLRSELAPEQIAKLDAQQQ
jgi:Spy/CpxP family protein refolding chaperone